MHFSTIDNEHQPTKNCPAIAGATGLVCDEDPANLPLMLAGGAEPQLADAADVALPAL